MYKLPMSKYKNAAPKLVKKEQILTGISTNRLSNTIGSLINCNLKHITFALDSTSGGSVCTFRHEDFLRRPTFSNDSFCVSHAHSGPITDIQYNQFNQSILATCGFDSQIQLWSINNDDSSNQPVQLNSLASIPLNENRSDCIQWNPNVDNIFVSTSLNTIYLWDINESKPSNVQAIRAHTEAIQGISWKRDGSLICTTAKDKTMLILDPRNINTNQNLKIENSKTANKDSKVVWIGTSDCILSSVYTSSFQREIYLWDIRNPTQPVHETQIDTGNNVLNPLYDYDTSCLFLIGKAESLVRYCEVFLNDSNWNFVCNSSQPVDDQIKGVCLMPKFGLDLMKCELDRLILLTRNSIYPLPYHIPRRAYYDFHSDVYPETYNIFESGLSKTEWLNGSNSNPVKTVLNPDIQKRYFNNDSIESVKQPTPVSTPTQATPNITIIQINTNTNSSENNNNNSNNNNQEKQHTSVASLILNINNKASSQPNQQTNNNNNDQPVKPLIRIKSTSSDDNSDKENLTQPQQPVQIQQPQQQTTNSVVFRSSTTNKTNNQDLLTTSQIQTERKTKTKSVYYQSKYKYINGKAAHKNEHITNIRNLSTMWPSECNGFQINSKHAAFLLSGSSGQIGIIELNKPGRLSDATLNTIVNRSKVSDFQWDPFDDETLAAACDDGTIKIWKIPEEGLDCSLEEPSIELRGHLERLYCIKYHPYAKNVIATASYDRTIKIWNIDTRQAIINLRGHTDVIFSISWSPCGTKLATICKDGYIRIYEPLASETPMIESKCGPGSGSKAARIEWVLNGKSLLVSGFGKGNLRQIYLFDSETLNLLQTEDINQSPSLLIPYYDSDINVLYLYAKGEETIYLYEIQEDEPYFQVLTPFKPDGLHFAIAFLPKIFCDIKSAEIAKAFRLTKDNRVEKMSFTVPRVKLGYFQDDIYPDTIDRRSYLSADEWFEGKSFNLNYINLQPEDMQKLTEILAIEQAQQPAKPPRQTKLIDHTSKGDMYDPQNLNPDERKIINSMLQRATLFYKEKSDEEDDNSDWN